MKMDEILAAIRMLAQGQGFYCRLYRRIMELKEYEPDSYDSLVETLEAQNFSDAVDMVLYFEC